ncbi:MAG: alpha-amylase family glycosyl hydrolase, partial [Coriobacteriia bacterium]|nr:alpha-amylase family glycosyl hydrolase [Coriobacteriia bacterium]
LVVNHTSSEHEWFKAGIADRNSPYHDYYYWRKARLGGRLGGKPGGASSGKQDGRLGVKADGEPVGVSGGKQGGRLPNNWSSLFEGKAWEYNEQLDEYYLHLFAKKQPDLNMDNPLVREEVKKIMRFWLDLGIDGFREDVITFISKADGLPNDWLMPAARGIRHYNNGPRVHEYLGEFKRDVFDHYDCITIGEAPMMRPRLALSYIAEDGAKELDLMFHFQHMEADCLFTDFYPRPFSLRKLKRAFSRWQMHLNGKAWNTLYLENHDHPRSISRFGSEQYRVQSGKMLAASFLFQQGTPFIYQGQEIGMTNIALETIDEYKDVQTINEYKRRPRQAEAKKMALIHRASRESARTPMQWSSETSAGFSSGKPWFAVNPNYLDVNVASQAADSDSLLGFYRQALRLRKEKPALIWGDYREHCPLNGSIFAYERRFEGDRILVVCSFTEKPKRFKAPKGFDLSKGELLLSNYKDNLVEGNSFVARAYETRVYLFDGS